MKILNVLVMMWIVFTACSSKEKTECYTSLDGKNDVELKLVISGNHVAGDMDYHLEGKDLNSGVVDGEFLGDTLKLIYRFESEGVESEREILFLKQEGKLAEGYGPMEQEGGNMVFTDWEAVEFGKGIILKKEDCK
ncbi:hypothetical protein V6R21_15510 [Limibacter armeniacum]|uniref:hypothetical protein n=1 Tax=Limibacter armeniacum TaxID=466084 RepID=UPI002FE691AA